MSYDPGRVIVADLLSGLGIEAQHQRHYWVAKCPSGTHEDRDPSWHIIDDPGGEKNGLHTCRSCHWGGTAVQLISKVLGFCTFSVLFEWIQEHAYGKARVVSSVEAFITPSALMGTRFRFPQGIIFEPLEEWPAAPRNYVLGRSIDARQVATWGIGYATEGELAGRVVVPTRAAGGLPVGYAARTYVGHPKRYLSPKEGSGQVRGAVAGEHLWPAPGCDRSTLYLVEGAFNALAVERALSETGAWRVGVGAIGGSLVHLGQINRVSTWGRVVILTDPDPAGDRAAEAYWAALARHSDRVRVRLPEGEDSDGIGLARLAEVVEPWARA